MCVVTARSRIRRARVRTWLLASLAGLGAVLAALLGVATNLATALVPPEWGWAWDAPLLWTGVAVLVILTATAAAATILLSDNPPDSDPSGPGTTAVPAGPAAGHSVQALRDEAGAARDRTPASAPPAAVVVTSNLPPRNPHFTGRATLLDEVADSLRSGPVAVTAVHGLGGVGKTQVALEVAYRGRDRGAYHLIWWIRAESTLTLTDDLAALAPELDVPIEREQERTVAAVLAALRRRDRWLLVFDNAPNSDDIQRWLPSGPGHVLITSRERAWTGLARTVGVEEFSRAESVDYLAKHAGATLAGQTPGVLDELAATLGDLPLALAQATAYLTRHGLSVTGYLRLYQDRKTAARLLATGLPGYPHSVATTWLIHFEELAERQPAALELLRFCAFLDPDDINLELLLSRPDLLAGRLTGRLAEAAQNPATQLELVGELAATGLVTRLDDFRVRMHRLVGQVTRQQLAADDAQAQRSWAGHVMRLVSRLFPDESWYPESWSVCADLAAHVTALESHGAPANVTGLALDHLGRYLDGRGKLRDAIAVLHRAVVVWETAFGNLRPQLADSLNSLGIVQLELDLVEEAQSTLDRAISVAKTTYGSRHPRFALILTSLGMVEERRGQPKRARALYRRALTILESAGESDSVDTAQVLGNLGNVLRTLGDLDGARSGYERAIVIFTAVYGPEHPTVAAALTNLGAVQTRLNQIEDAKHSITRALRIKEAAYGPGHPDNAYTLVNLGALQLKEDAFEEARVSLRRALEIQEAAYGPEHPEIALTLYNLGMAEAPLGALDDAREHWRRALSIIGDAYGPAHEQARLLRELLDQGWHRDAAEEPPEQPGK